MNGSIVSETDCCIVGAGPAGAMLGLLLARQGVRVQLLEAREDFDREFRGDTLHPSSLEVLDQLGLAERALGLSRARLEQAVLQTPAGAVTVADFRHLKTKFPFIALIPQEHFLELLTADAAKYSSFHLRMGANVRELVRQDNQVVGVEFDDDNGRQEVRSKLVVACDGRFSRLRKQSGLNVVATSPPMDVLWFRLPRGEKYIECQLMARLARGKMLIILPRDTYDQVGYVILKGQFREVREEGIEAFRASLAALEPAMRDRVHAIEDFKDITPLTVNSDRLKQWYSPGLLLLGDAAHVMSPVGGVGINYAIQDAVAASNLLGSKLLAGEIELSDLAAVQSRRQFPTRVIQTFQSIIQKRIIRQALDESRPFRIPWFLRLPLIRKLPARILAFGIRRERVQT